MPYCPNCKAEYREGFTKCSDCDTELVDALPQEGNPISNKVGYSIKGTPIIFYIIGLCIVFILVVIIVIGYYKNELKQVNNNFAIMSRRMEDANTDINKKETENSFLKSENENLKKQVQELLSANASAPDATEVSSTTTETREGEMKQDIITVQKLEYKDFDYYLYSGRGAQVKVLIYNTTNEDFTVISAAFKAVTTQNRTVPTSSGILISYEEETESKVDLETVDLLPGTQSDGTIFFELKKGEDIKTIVYSIGKNLKIEIPVER